MSLQQNTKCKLSLLLWLNEEDDPKKVFFSTIIFSSAASKKRTISDALEAFILTGELKNYFHCQLTAVK